MKNKGLLLAGGAALAFGAAYRILKMTNPYSFEGKVVLVTGGSRGLGIVLSRLLIEEGAKIAVCARNEEELERAEQELRQRTPDFLAVKCDVTKREEVEEMVSKVRERYGRIDVLINNAGTISVAPFEVMTLDDFKIAMDTHFWAPLYTTFAVLPEMQQRGEGKIVNISSIGGKIAVPHMTPYSASKFALVGLSAGLRSELKKYGITVTTICPWLTRTGSPRNVTFKGKNEDEYAWFSISDSIPVASMNAERSAKRILNAVRYGRAEMVLSVQGRLATIFYSAFPDLTADLMTFMNDLLPEPGGIGTGKATGAESKSEISPSVLTYLTDKAAEKNNEIL